MTKEYQQYKNNFLTGKFKDCRSFFEENNYYLEAGYCYLILDKKDKAKEYFESLKDVDIRAHWALLVLQMIDNKISTIPTYFEIRSFLEADLDIFITYCKGDIVEKIISYCDFMAVYNLECYKFIGRAFWAHNLMQPAMYFLNRAKDKLYNDPELHYLLAYIYYEQDNNIQKCQKELETCLNILPEYAPAAALKEKLKKIKNI